MFQGSGVQLCDILELAAVGAGTVVDPLPIFSAERESDSHYPFSERLTFRVIALAAQHGPEQYTEVLEEDITNESLKEEARWRWPWWPGTT